jgi:hypothetical protein
VEAVELGTDGGPGAAGGGLGDPDQQQREPAEQDVSADAVFQPVVDRPQLTLPMSRAWLSNGTPQEFKAFPEVSKLIAERESADEQSSLQLYRSEAAELGVSFDRVHQSINVVDELPKLSFVRGSGEFAPFLKATWRLLSGYEHGLGWALLKGSERRAAAKIPGGMNVELVIDDNEFVNAAKSTYFLFLSACRLLKRRHLEPSRG